MCRLCALLLTLFVGAGAGLAQTLELQKALIPLQGGPAKDAKEGGKTGDVEPKFTRNGAKVNDVEVKFSDGSTVRVVILQENIEVVTKFGKLVVPMSEVRKIDLGLHLEDGTADKIQAAMKRLSSQAFKDRDEAVNQLVELGPAAFATLEAASKSKDPEVTQRVQMALKRIKAKYPPDMLRRTTQDRVVTHDFPIVGRITTPVIKAQNPIIGALNLKLADLHSLLLMGGNTDIEVLIDATKYCHRTNWMDAGVTIEAGTGLNLTAAGEVDLLPGNGGGEFISGPEGNFNVGGRGGPGNQIPGQLLARIGENGTPFFIGRGFNGVRTEEGKLYVRIVPGPWGNQPAQGSYKLKISTGLSVR